MAQLGQEQALMFEPFNDNPATSGLALMPYDEMEKMIIAADKLGFQIGVHAIGDKGNNWVLNAYEKAEKVNGKRDSRHRIEHAQTLQPSDIPRFARLGVIASMQPTHCISDKNSAKNVLAQKGQKVHMHGKVLQMPVQYLHLAQIIRLNRLILWRDYTLQSHVKTGLGKKVKAGTLSRNQNGRGN